LVGERRSGRDDITLPDFMIEMHIDASVLTPVLRDYLPPEARMFVVCPTGNFLHAKLRSSPTFFLSNLRTSTDD